MKTEIKIQVRAYPVELKDHRTGETSTDVIVLSKEMLQAAGLLGLTDGDLIYRAYNRKGYKVLEIGAVHKQEITVDLEELYNKQIRMEQLQAFGEVNTATQPDNQEAEACDK